MVHSPDFFSKNQIHKLTGVYFPYWVVDAEVDGQLQATGKVFAFGA